MFWLSNYIISKIGVNWIMVISLLSYTIRFIIYATITNPYHAIPAEIMRGATFASFWAGATYHVYKVAPDGLSATFLGILNAMYAGLGQSIGSLVGGKLSDRYGISNAFIVAAKVDAVALFGFIAYQLINHIKDKDKAGNHRPQTIRGGGTTCR